MKGEGCRVQGAGCRLQGAGCRGQGARTAIADRGASPLGVALQEPDDQRLLRRGTPAEAGTFMVDRPRGAPNHLTRERLRHLPSIPVGEGDEELATKIITQLGHTSKRTAPIFVFKGRVRSGRLERGKGETKGEHAPNAHHDRSQCSLGFRV